MYCHHASVAEELKTHNAIISKMDRTEPCTFSRLIANVASIACNLLFGAFRFFVVKLHKHATNSIKFSVHINVYTVSFQNRHTIFEILFSMQQAKINFCFFVL